MGSPLLLVLHEDVMSIVDDKAEQMRGLCHKHGVKELYVFGSALREDFGPDSDVDLGVVFSRNGIAGSFDQYFDFKSEMERLLARPVDLVCRASIRNSVFARKLTRPRGSSMRHDSLELPPMSALPARACQAYLETEGDVHGYCGYPDLGRCRVD
jgi:predicted nucleotidyltransferase